MERVNSTEVSEVGEGEGLEAGLQGLDIKDPKEQVNHSADKYLVVTFVYSPFFLQPRTEYLEWAEYFLAVSFLSAMRSKDPATQVLNLHLYLHLCLHLRLYLCRLYLCRLYLCRLYLCLYLHFHLHLRLCLLLCLHLLMIRLEPV